jgi:hypothetical protein
MTKREATKIAKIVAVYIRQHGYSAPGAITAAYAHTGIKYEGGAFRF